MARNRERDIRSSKAAIELGWRVVRVWECEVRLDAEDVARRVLDSQGANESA